MSKLVLSLKGLQRDYDVGDGRKLTVLKGVDLDVAAGELVGLVGPSGSGKSSLLHAIGLLEAAPNTRLLIDEQDFAGADDNQRTVARLNKIGFVYQFHHLLPESKLHIIGEYFLPIHFHLMVLPGVERKEIRTVHSHIHALGQCRKYIRKNGWRPMVAGDTAGAAKLVAEAQDRTMAALAPKLAASLYGLDILEENVEDTDSNVTRFVVLTKSKQWAERPSPDAGMMTTFIFRVRNVPAALYKAMGGFATNGVNMTKLESYQLGAFTATLFYADIEGHPDDPSVRNALEELRFFSREVRILDGMFELDSIRWSRLSDAAVGRPSVSFDGQDVAVRTGDASEPDVVALETRLPLRSGSVLRVAVGRRPA